MFTVYGAERNGVFFRRTHKQFAPANERLFIRKRDRKPALCRGERIREPRKPACRDHRDIATVKGAERFFFSVIKRYVRGHFAAQFFAAFSVGERAEPGAVFFRQRNESVAAATGYSRI